MKAMKETNAYQWYMTALIMNEEDPYDCGHMERRPCSPVYMSRQTAEQNKPEKKDIDVGSPLGGCRVIDIY